MIQDYLKKEIRAAAILTTSYVAATVIDGTADLGTASSQANNFNQLILYIDFTKGSLTSAEVKIEYSYDGVNYYQESFGSITTGTKTVTLGENTIAASGAYRLSLPIKDRFIKVSAKGTGTVTGSSMAITSILGNV